MECAVDNALNKYQDKLKKQELSYDLFLTSIDDDLVEIQDLIKKIKKRANGFDGLDFTEEIKSLFLDMIWYKGKQDGIYI